MTDNTRPEYGSEQDKRAVLAAIEKWLYSPGARYRVSANAFPNEIGQRWLALLIERFPTDTETSLSDPDLEPARRAAHSHTRNLDKAPECPASSPVQRSTEGPLGEQARRIGGIESLAILGRSLLLETMVVLWSYADSLGRDPATPSQRHAPKSKSA